MGADLRKAERFSSVSHLIGAAAALMGLVLLVAAAAQQNDPLKTVSVIVYGASLLALYTASALYHTLTGIGKRWFREFDHLAIYLLIAGTYTPFTLVTLRGAWGWSLFGVVWGLATIGMLLEWKGGDRRRIIPVVLYLLMGWLVVVAVRPLMDALPAAGVTWLLAGGLCYTAGIAFYAFDKRVWYFHGLWHLFVLGGSVCHYLTVWIYVV
jgi:hemolysin III